MIAECWEGGPRLREPKPCPDIALGVPRQPAFELEIGLVTPLVGGSAEPGKVDTSYPIRPASVRGQLRFWWRVCRAGRYQSPQELYRAEAAVWGSVERRSQVEICTEVTAPRRPYQWAQYRRGRDGGYRSIPEPVAKHPPYALWPFRGELRGNRSQVDKPPAEVLADVRFRLRIFLNDLHAQQLEREVEAALWAWLNFGGVGARTRRGCGALVCISDQDARFRPPPVGELGHWLGERARVLVAAPAVAGQPLLPQVQGARALWRAGAGPEGTCPPLTAWSEALGQLHDFRQKVGIARDERPGQPRPGRSRWPEADSIREAAKLPTYAHRPCHPARPFYPRADLGLPIVFQFKGQNEPDQHELEAAGQGATRMASPIILKPLALSLDEAVPFCLVLAAPHVWSRGTPGVRLSGPRGVNPLIQTELEDPAKARLTRPLSDVGADNARTGFVNYLAKAGWTGVTLP